MPPKLETNFIIILNDNNMSISENVGGVSKYLNNIRTATGISGSEGGDLSDATRHTRRGNRVIERNTEGKEQPQAAGDSGHVL